MCVYWGEGGHFGTPRCTPVQDSARDTAARAHGPRRGLGARYRPAAVVEQDKITEHCCTLTRLVEQDEIREHCCLHRTAISCGLSQHLIKRYSF